MLVNIATLFVIVAFAIAFGWVTRRAWRSQRAIVKWPGTILGGLLTLLFALIAIVGAKGIVQLYMPYPVAPAQITVANTPEQVARGEHLAIVLCASCHSENGQLPLSGGLNLSADTGMPLGDLYPPNISPGGAIKGLTDNDLYRILYTGVAPSGRLTFMTAVNTRFMSHDDALAVIAYLRQAPMVEAQRPPLNFSFLMALLVGAGLVNLDVPATITPVNAPPKAVTRAYGEYVMSFMDCRGCHGPTLSGDAPPPAPPSPNLTVIVPNWTRDEFVQAMRTGIDKTGHQIQPPMPWKTIGQLDDVELSALYEYLHGLQPIVRTK